MEMLVSLVLTIFVTLIHKSNSSGQLEINVLSFRNPVGLNIDGSCCDGVNLVDEQCPTGSCDHAIEVCVSQIDGLNEKCKIFVGPPDTNDITFYDNNQFLYSFDRWQGGVLISVNITDLDSGKSDLVDYYNITLTKDTVASYLQLPTVANYNFTGSRYLNATSLQFSVSTYCDSYYYQDCSVRCIDNDECDGHYTCGSKGAKICNFGWRGTNCDQIIQGSQKDCSVYDTSIFEISKWISNFECYGANDELLLDITEVLQETKEIFGTITINTTETSVEGHYNPLGLQLSSTDFAIGTYLNLTFFDMSATKKNATHLDGVFRFRSSGDDHRCPLKLDRISGEDDIAPNRCDDKGTCVRYGAAKSQTYCCCYDGSQGKTCKSSVTTKPSFFTSITTMKTSTSATSQASTTETATSPASSTPIVTSLESTTLTTPESVTSSTTSESTQASSGVTSSGVTSSGVTSSGVTSSGVTSSGVTSPVMSSISTSPNFGETTDMSSSTDSSTTQTLESQSTEEITQPSPSAPSSSQTTMSSVSTSSTSEKAFETSITELGTDSTSTSSQSKITSIETTTNQPVTDAMTESTTTDMLETPESTMQPTTEIPKPFIPDKSYQLKLEAAPEELKDDDRNLEDVITEAYYEANIDVVEKRLIIANVTDKRDALGDDGVLIVEVTYTLVINSTTINTSTINQPTTAQWTFVLHRNYAISVYLGVDIWYLEYTYSFYALGRPPVIQQYNEMELEIFNVWELNSRLVNESYNITILTTEEYVGEMGEEVYRLYYIVTNINTSSMYHPSNTTAPSSVQLDASNIFTIYHGISTRYRFSYGVIFYDVIDQSELVELSTVSEKVWDGFTTLNVSVIPIRVERYMGKEGEYLMKFLYFVKRGSRLISPIQWKGPAPKNFKSWLEVIDINNRYLRVYTSDVHYRYAHHTGLYIEDRIDRKDWTVMKEQLEKTWSELVIGWNKNGFSIKIVATIDYTTNTSEMVQLLTYYIYRKGMIIDASLLDTHFSVTKELETRFKVMRTYGDQYIVITQRTFVELRTQYSFYVGGIISKTDFSYFEQSLISTWNLTKGYTESDLTVKITYIDERIDIKTEMTVSKIYYTLQYKLQLVDAYAVKISQNFTIHLESAFNVHTKYQKYMLYKQTVTNLITKRYSYSLYFTSKMTRLDFTTLQRRLYSVLKTYLGLSYEFEIIVANQEEYYTVFDKESFEMSSTRSTVWKINYFIKTSNLWVYPKFVKKIYQSDLKTSLQFEMINKKTSNIYLESRNELISYSYHFSLDFKEPVYYTDWLQIQISLETAWKKQTGMAVKISIQNVEQLVDVEGNIYYSMVYFIQHQQSWIYSLNWQTLDLTILKLDFLNVHGYKYEYFSIKEEWKLSYSFHIGSDMTVSSTDITTLKLILRETWCYSLATFISDCSKIEIFPVKQVSETSQSGIKGWDFRYFIKYEGNVIDVSTWPALNIHQFLQYYQSHSFVYKYKFFLNLNYLYRYFQFKIYLNTHVERTDYDKIKESILSSWLKQNTRFNSTTGLKVIIDSQKEKVDIHGESSWELGYHIEVNGNTLRPEATKPLKPSDLQIEIHNKTINGKYEISSTTSKTSSSLISTSSFAGLIVNSKIEREDKYKFQSALEMYFRNISNIGAESNVTVTIGPMKEVISANGHHAWELTYHVAVNGSSVSVEKLKQQIDYSYLQHFLQIKTKYGKTVSVSSSNTTQKKSMLFSVALSHKVTKINLENNIATQLTKVFKELNPEYENCSCLGVKIWNLQEQISATGESTWKVEYQVNVNGRPIDASLVTWPEWKLLNKYLKHKTSTGYEVNVVDTTNIDYRSTSLFHSLYFNSFIAQSTYTNIKTSLTASWSKTFKKLGIVGDLKFKFWRYSEWSSTLKKSVWKLDYEIMLNSTRLDITTVDIDKTSYNLLQQSISNIQSPSGVKYKLIDVSTFKLREYAMHFPLYFTTMVSQSGFVSIKEFIKKTWYDHWKEMNFNQTEVEIHEQKVMVDMEGKFVYQLVYFLTHNGEVVDSRLYGYQKILDYISTNLKLINPRGQYYKVLSKVSHLIREETLFNIVIHRPLTTSTKVQFLEFIKSAVSSNMTGQKLSIDVLQQEEVLTETSMSVWKVKFYIKSEGEYIVPATVDGLSAMDLYSAYLNTSLNLNFNVLQFKKDQLYSYKDRFVLFFKKNVSETHWSILTDALVSFWNNHTEYKDCNCVSIKIKGMQEVVDRNGITRFKLVYFLYKSNVLVSSQISVDVEFEVLQNVLVKKSTSYEMIKITETESTRIDSTFSIYLNRGIRFDHREVTEQAILDVLITKNENCCTNVEILRQMEFLTIKGKSLWQTVFKVTSLNVTVDVKRLESINATSLQETLHQNLLEYQIEDNTTMILDLRKSYSLYLTTPVRQTDLIHFQQAVYRYIRKSVSVNISVIVPQVTQVVDIEGSLYQKLSAFTTFNGVQAYPGQGGNLNITLIQQEINSMGIKGAKAEYTLIDREITEHDVHYSYSLEQFIDRPVKHKDLKTFQHVLELSWTRAIRAEWKFKIDFDIKIEIVRQEEYLDISGKSVYKLVYYLHKIRDNMTQGELPSNQLPKLPVDKIHLQVLIDVLVIGEYKLVKTTEIVQYSSLFTVFLKSPVLLPDIDIIQSNLQQQWSWYLKKEVSSVVIVSQEEVVDVSSRSSMWQVSYTVKSSSTIHIDSNYQEELNETDYRLALDVNYTDTGNSYKDLITSRPDSSTKIIRYKETYSVYFTQRIIETFYSKFETALISSWKLSRNETVNITIAGQQEVIAETGMTSFKLLYIVSKSEKQITLYNNELSYNELKNTIVISTAVGTNYKVMEVEESFKLEAAFQVYVSQAVYRVDRTLFKEAVKTELGRLMPGKEFNNTEVEWRSQTSFLSIKNPGVKIWRQLFIVRRNGKVVSAEKQRKLTQLVSNFTSLAGQNYTVVSTSLMDGFTKEENLFSLSVTGRISTTITTLTTILQSSWTKFDSKWTIAIREPEEYIGANGAVVTRIPYLVMQNSTVTFPDVTRAPTATSIVAHMSTQLKETFSVYDGKKLVKYNSCFTLSVKREVGFNIQTNEIEVILTRTWRSVTQEKDVVVSIESTENFVGDFGVKIDQILYTVTLDKIATEPSFDIKPNDTLVLHEINNVMKYRWSLYKGVNTYRLGVLFSLDVAYSSSLFFTIETKRLIEASLEDVWSTNNPTVCENCTVSVVSRKMKIGYNKTIAMDVQETVVAQLHYMVQSKGEYLKSYQTTAPTSELINTHLNQFELVVWTEQTFVARSVYFEGYSWNEKDEIYSAGLHEAWKQDSTTEINITLIDVTRYVDENWNKLTKVQYIVFVNGSDPVQAQLNNTDITAAFNKIGEEKSACSCKPLKHRKLFVKGSPGSVDHKSVGIAIRAAWMNVNHNSSSLHQLLKVKTKKENSRKKRAVSESTNQTKYIGDDGDEISPVDYTLSVNDQEPDPVFLNSPTEDDLDAAGVNGCNCSPRKAGSLRLDGDVEDSQFDDVKKAVYEAVVKANPDISAEDLEVDILNLSDGIKDSNNNELSEVNYAINRKDGGDIEDVNYPTSAHLDEALKNHGLALYEKRAPSDEEDDDWKVIVGAVFGAIAALIIVVVATYIIVQKRKQRKMNLKKQERDVSNDIYDEENFSSAVAYSNQVYETQEAKIDFREPE